MAVERYQTQKKPIIGNVSAHQFWQNGIKTEANSKTQTTTTKNENPHLFFNNTTPTGRTQSSMTVSWMRLVWLVSDGLFRSKLQSFQMQWLRMTSSGCGLNRIVLSYLVVDRAAVCGVRAMAPLLRAGCHGTKDAALVDRLPESPAQHLPQPNRSDNVAGRLAESHSRTRILSKH